MNMGMWGRGMTPRNDLLIDWLIGEGLGLVVSITRFYCFLIGGGGTKKVN